jgi:peroxiredoxin
MRVPLPALALASLVVLGSTVTTASAAGWVLDGRVAPDLTFGSGGLNGVSQGTSLSQFRGRVVWIKFWLRDCPICRRALPAYQEAHARYGGRGLVALSVLHGFPPSDGPLNQFMQQSGYTFPVGSDVDGRQAGQYGVHVRPTDYIIGVDGRVKASNGAPDTTLRHELGLYRLAKVDPLPASLKSVRDAVWADQVGRALREAAAAAAAPGAGADVKDAVRKVEALAQEDVAGRKSWIAWLGAQQSRAGDAQREREQLAADYRGTSLEASAR